MVQKTSKSKKHATRKTRRVSRATLSVNDIRNRFKEMDSNVRSVLKQGMNDPHKLGKHVSRQWATLFKKPLSSKAADSLASHFLNLYGKKRGGSAPIDYVMRPGLPAVSTYATFPTEIGTSPSSIKDLDVYYNSGLAHSCGQEDTSATPWSGIGTNVVPLKGGKRKTMKRKGGNFMTTLAMRPYVATNPSGFLMRGTEQWSGVANNPHDFSDPSKQAWGMLAPKLVDTPPDLQMGEITQNLASHPKFPGAAVPGS